MRPVSPNLNDAEARRTRSRIGLLAAGLSLAATLIFLLSAQNSESISSTQIERTKAVSFADPAAITSRKVSHEPVPLEPGFPNGIRLLGDMQGEAAIEALGDRLPELADFYDKTPEELERELRTDPSLKVNRSGQLFYACDMHCAHGHQAQAAESATAIASMAPTDTVFDTSQAFLLHSRPGANRVIHLDFDGHADNTPGYWKDGAASPAYNISGNNPAIFEDDERLQIIEIWQRVAEDYAMFDIDVTTEDPGVEALRKTSSSDVQYGMRCVIGGSTTTWYGGSVGGVALSSTFNANQDVPCWVFPVGGTGFVPKNVGEAASHEVGHTLGLAHDGIERGEGATEGWGNWAPIMGKGYYKPITHWNKGEYAKPNNTQDDLAVMLSKGAVYRPDDHGGAVATATKLTADSSTASVSGVIGRNTDLDFFRIDATGPTLTINIKPITRGANLRLEVKLYNSSGVLLQTATSADTSAASTGGTRPVTLSQTVTAGVFYFSVDGTGNGDPLDPVTPGYSDYGSLGHYSGTVSGVVSGGFTWTTTTAGAKQWNTVANWTSGVAPNAAAVSVRVNNDISGDQTIQLTSATTLGSLDLGDSNSTNMFTLAPSGGSMVFNNSGNAASLNKTSGGNDIISAPVSLTSGLVLTQSSTGTLSFSGGISGSGALTKEGAGTVVFSSANTYTGVTTLDDGLLRLDHATGLPGGIDNAVGVGESRLAFEGGVLGLATGDFTRQLGTGAGQLDWVTGSGGFAAFGADRQVRLNNGTGVLSWGTAILGDGNILILSHSTATHTLDFRNGIGFAGLKRTIQVEDGAAEVDATLSGVLSEGGGFTKTGPGVLSLSNANTYTGSVTVADGVLRLQNASALTTANLDFKGGGVLGLGAGDLTDRTIGTAAGQVQWLGSGGFAAFGATRAVKFDTASINWVATNFLGTGRVLILSHDDSDATLDWQQPISLAGFQRTVHVDDGSAAIDAKMSGVIAGGNSTNNPLVNIFNKTGAGTLAFTAQNSYWGDTIINSGTLMIGDGGSTGGVSQNTPSITVEPGAILAVNRNNTVTQGLAPFKVALTGEGGLTQAGTGNTVLMLANTYIGPTSVTAGTLTLGAVDVLPDTSEIFIGTATLAAGAFAETMGRLTLTGTATVQLATGAVLAFEDSSAVDWSSGTLTLTGPFVSGSSLRFGTTSSGLTSAQLARISASGFANFALDANGYLTALSTSGFTYWTTFTYTNGPLPLNQRGPADDFDKDGLSNLLEFALAGQDPTVPNGSTGSLSGLTFSFTKRPGTSGLTYAIESSTSLGASATWTEVTGGSYINNASVISYVLPTGPARLFMRLRVTSP